MSCLKKKKRNQDEDLQEKFKDVFEMDNLTDDEGQSEVGNYVF